MRQVYYNGPIITLENKKVEAILVENGKILKIGTEKEILKNVEDTNFEQIDLKGNCLMPSFIDSHSHIVSFAQTLGIAQLQQCSNYEDIINTMKKFKHDNNINNEEWIVGFGYDHNFLKEKKQPTKIDLDKISKTNPIMITHKSGHMGVLNTKALEILGINARTKDPEGGKIGRVDNTNEPNGYLEESAFVSETQKIQINSKEQMTKLIKKAEKIYASYGITTAQEGLTKKIEYDLLKSMADKKILDLDIISYIDIENTDTLVNKEMVGKYYNNYKIGGYKLFLDGSPQGKTAWISKPYEGEENYCGYPLYETKQVENFVNKSAKEKIQLITHCNGDNSAEQLIQACEKYSEIKNYRPVMIHAQLVRKDQLPRMKAINMIPSFFIAHVYYWGDIHIKNLGKRAQDISPIKSAIENGMIYTMHQDTPVLLPNMFETIWCAVNRQTQGGIELGSNQKITVEEAIKGVTINSAYQYFEEKEKGSIKEGKKADFIIVDKNPLDINKEELKNITILCTIKNGKIIYKREKI